MLLGSGRFSDVFLINQEVHKVFKLVVPSKEEEIESIAHYFSDLEQEAKESILWEAEVLDELRGIPHVRQYRRINLETRTLVLDYFPGILLAEMQFSSAEHFYRFILELVKTVIRVNQRLILHKDLKIDNILYNPRNYDFTIIDFGNATFGADFTPRFDLQAIPTLLTPNTSPFFLSIQPYLNYPPLINLLQSLTNSSYEELLAI